MGMFDGFDSERRGPWPPKVYDGVIIKEYETTGNFAAVHKTGDTLSNTGDSRNIKLCVKLIKDVKVSPPETQDLFYTVNYRAEALTAERVAELRKLREKYKGQMNWPDANDQRDNLTLVRLHELEKAGFVLDYEEGKGFNTKDFIGKASKWFVQVRRQKANPKRKGEDEVVPRAELNDPSSDKTGWYNRIAGVNEEEKAEAAAG